MVTQVDGRVIPGGDFGSCSFSGLEAGLSHENSPRFSPTEAAPVTALNGGAQAASQVTALPAYCHMSTPGG